MEDFDIFTNKIEFTKTLLKNTLNKLVYDHRSTPNGPNYESGRKLLAEECLANGDEEGCAFHLSEGVAFTVRTMTLYRDEQIRAAGDKLHKITPYLPAISELTSTHPISEAEQSILDTFVEQTEDLSQTLNKFTVEEEVPLHKRYLRFSQANNVDNFKKILKELPKEWTIIQLTGPYNGRENISPRAQHRADVGGLLLTVLAGDHVDTPFTLTIPANVTKEGEKPLFEELYAILDENYKTIDNAHALNNKRLVQNYWARREDIDLRMKSLINVMERRWLGGWVCLLGGRVDLADTLRAAVDATLADWGMIRLTDKQRMLLYKLMSSASVLTSHQTRSCLREILTEHGDTDELRRVLEPCEHCTKLFRCVKDLCRSCLSRSFECIHGYPVSVGVDALADALRTREETLRRAHRHPVILIVDEILDSFPWESLSVLKSQGASRVDSLHSLYRLYKRHERRVVRGLYVTAATHGRYVINPERNLDRMEKRMSSFVEYWCGEWRGHAGRAPPPDDFLAYLRTADIFLYCGHGDGCQLVSGGAGVEGARGARAVCLLSGCGSVRLHAPRAARHPPAGAHRRLHVAGCPTVVGMLWEVTDLEVDKVVTTLVSLCVPSPAPAPWHRVGKGDWSRGLLVIPESGSGAVCEREREREVVRAVCRARASTAYTMIASSVVVRGLPVLILPDKTT